MHLILPFCGAQGTIETQWIRRTYVTTDFFLPSVLHRSPVSPENVRLRDFSPIEVSTRQIRERAEIVKGANDAGDAMKLQQLLHGTLIPQVNEGPAKIAEVFLGEGYKADEEHQREMRGAFDVLMCELQRGVKLHEKWVASNQGFETLQQELENGLENLTNTISSL